MQRAAIQEGSAPGTRIQQSDDVAQMLDDAYESFRPLYDQAKGFPVQPAIVNAGQNVPLSQAVKTAIDDPGIIATDEQRRKILNFVEQ